MPVPMRHLKCLPPPASPGVPQHLLIPTSRILILPHFNYLLCRASSSHEPLQMLRSVSAGLGHREHLCLLLLEGGYVVGRASEHRGLPSIGLKC